ncbi:MAG: iron-containing alcohol dehydrogenase [Christensenellaceae bacterium]|nr:iron-containing alcohol dehydrogenase [Christensenellaceae bacterium]
MIDFNYYSPTKVIFGKDSISQLGETLKNYKHILVHFGGGSVKTNGILDAVTEQLDLFDVKYTLLGGVSPNPLLSLCHKGIDICKNNNIDFILAVGGGSTIDSSKCIALGSKYDGDIWDAYSAKAKPDKALPIGVVLTIAAAGSELSGSSVITNDEGARKYSYAHEAIRPKFAFMNPEFTFTVSKYQTACGIVDILMHTFERYFTMVEDVALTDSLCEALCKNVINAGWIAYNDPTNYEARATLMWAGSISHNGLMGVGRQMDFGTHKLEHELSALYANIAHGAGLAVLFPQWCRYAMDVDIDRFCRFAKEIWGVYGDGLTKKEWAEKGIITMETFFRSLGMPKNLRELGIKKEDIAYMAKKCADFYTQIGSFKPIMYEDMINIYNLAF